MKMFKYALLTSSVFALASCSSDAPEINGSGDGTVTFTLQVPSGLGTRAFGDGKSALNLQYAVYEEDGSEAVITSLDGSENQVKFAEGALSTTVSLQLLNGKSYEIIFWADNENAPYTFDATTKSITLNYDGLAVNDESRDAFYAVESTGKINGPISKTIRLTRPFAQVNLGTDDLQSDEVKRVYGSNIYTSASVSATAYTTLNLATGTVSNPVAVKFGAGSIPTGETFRVPGYDLLQMNYLLVPQTEGTLGDFTFDFYLENSETSLHTVNVPNVPLQANYRTNIYGSLLTSTTDFTVVKDPIFDGDIPVKVVSTPQQLVAAMQDGGSIEVPLNTHIDLTEMLGKPGNSIVIDKPTTLIIHGSIEGADGGQFVVNAPLELTGGGSVTGGIRGIFFIEAGGTLTADNITFNTPESYRGGDVWNEGGGDMSFKNCTFNSNMASVTFQPMNADKVCVIENCTINSTSRNSIINPESGYTTWSYALRVQSVGTMVVKDCNIKAIQGGIAATSSGVANVYNTTITITNSPGKQDGFYCLYTGTCGILNAYSGYFSSPRYASLNGNNDNYAEFGTLNLYGGFYSSKGWSQQNNNFFDLPEGYEYKELTDMGDYKWEVVKK